MKKDRINSIDALRGISIIAMFVHHTLFLMSDFFGFNIAFLDTTFFAILQMIFVSIFLLVSGISTNFSKSVLKRGIIVFSAALLLSFATIVICPLIGIKGVEIYFGILHMFGLSMIIYGLIQKLFEKIKPVYGAAIFFVIFVVYYYFHLNIQFVDSPYFVLFGFPYKGFFSADYYPLFPYFFMFLVGTYIGKWVVSGKFPAWFYKIKVPVVDFIGQYSLWFYCLHQPVIFLVLYLIFGM